MYWYCGCGNCQLIKLYFQINPKRRVIGNIKRNIKSRNATFLFFKISNIFNVKKVKNKIKKIGDWNNSKLYQLSRVFNLFGKFMRPVPIAINENIIVKGKLEKIAIKIFLYFLLYKR